MVRVFGGGRVYVSCLVCVCVSDPRSIQFALRCAHKRIVNIMKVYIERNNLQVELIRFRNMVV